MRRRLIAVAAAVLLVTAGVGAVADDVTPPTADRNAGIAFEEVGVERGFDYNSTVSGQVTGNGRQGVYVTDYNRDGWPDLLAIGGQPSPVIFENTGGSFERANALPRGAEELRSVFKSALFFDYDADGWEDVLLLPTESNPVLLHNDDGTFRPVDDGMDAFVRMPVGATALDYNGDGCLDVFVAASGDWAEKSPVGYHNPNVTVEDDNGAANRLYRGDCSGSFERVEDAGISGEHWSLATSAADFTGDGRPDIHVANDFYRDVVYVNQGDGTFRRTMPADETARNGMSSEVADVNGDGRLDVFVTNIHLSPENASSDVFRNYIRHRIGKRGRGNNLLLNTGNGTFRDAASEYGVADGGWGWAAVAEDFDNDGDRDLFHTTSELGGLDPRDYRRYAPPRLWERTDGVSDDRGESEARRGATRTDGGFDALNSSERGFSATNGRGAAALDFDRDGDLDLAVATLEGRFRLYENTGANGHSLEVTVGGDRPTLGARVYVTTNGTTQMRAVTSGSDFLSQDTRTAHFGLDGHGQVDRVRVVWPDGTERTFADVSADRHVRATPDGLVEVSSWRASGLDRFLDGFGL